MTTEYESPSISEQVPFTDDPSGGMAALPDEQLPPPESFVPIKGSLNERTEAQVEADAIDTHIKLAGQLIEGSGLNTPQGAIGLSIAHSLAAFTLMMRRSERDG